MCFKPYLIKNPNINRYKDNHLLTTVYDTKSQYIPIPCGHCPACLALKQAYFIQRFQMESINNDLWTGMLSYNNTHLPSVEINGYRHKYADSRDVQLLIKRLRNDNVFDSFKYWFISERGTDYHRPHWHFLISTPKIEGETLAQKYDREKYYFDAILSNWYTNLGSRRKPIKSPNLTYCCRNGKRNYDFHYVNPSLSKNGQTDCAFYVSKYYLKDDDYTKRLYSALRLNILDDDTFKYYWSLLRHKTLSSHYLGDYRDSNIRSYLDMCIDFSLSVNSMYPLFINQNTSQTFPLSPYYRKHLITVDQAYKFALNNPNRHDGVLIMPDVNLDDIARKWSQYDKIIKRINIRDIDYQILIYDDYTKFDNITEDFNLCETITPLDKNIFGDSGIVDFCDTLF